MSEKIGKEYEGIVSGVTSHGLFVELPNTIEGFVPVESLPGYNYELFPTLHLLKGTKGSYQIGEAVKIRVTDVDFYRRRAEFRILEKTQNTPTVYETNE